MDWLKGFGNIPADAAAALLILTGFIIWKKKKAQNVAVKKAGNKRYAKNWRR